MRRIEVWLSCKHGNRQQAGMILPLEELFTTNHPVSLATKPTEMALRDNFRRSSNLSGLRNLNPDV